jgi:hypothetical protein
MKPENRPRKREDCEVEEVADGLVLHFISDGSVHLLNLTAAFIWECCDGTRSPSDIARALAEVSGTEWQNVLKDVENTLLTFQESGLLQ